MVKRWLISPRPARTDRHRDHRRQKLHAARHAHRSHLRFTVHVAL